MLPVVNMQIDTVKKALSAKKIAESTDKEISQVLSLIYTIIGLRQQHFPSRTDDVILFTFLRNEYGNKTLDELLLAFNLAIKDELDISDTKVYDQFTCEYLARIMTAYRKWIKKINKEVPPVPKMRFHNSITTQEEKQKDIEDWEGREKVSIEFIPPYLFDYLVEFEKIFPTRESKWEAMGRAADYRKEQLHTLSMNMRPEDIFSYQAFISMHKEGVYKGLEIERLKNLGKKIMVFDYLTNRK